ncbi:NACHT domain-containing protein [Streptomyces sp. NPDC048448]|uniref:NACHT domain-containing protein n=1 Tax=Streptomyces sp. NPDC048448 TaxID=3365554 RepID=UPI00371C79BA
MQEERAQGDSEFERRYLQYVEARHGSLVLYGVDLDDRLLPTRLSSGYLSISAVDPTREHTTVPAEDLLARHSRVMLRGAAGAGKTTLLQWLAVRAAQDGLESGLQRGRIPFMLPLRAVLSHRRSLPDPDQFLSTTGVPLNGVRPERWVTRVLAEGRGLLLVDGIDEVDADRREDVRRWLGDLLIRYPDTQCIVTSRPSATRGAWLEETRFAEYHLAPMTLDDVRAFIELWHAVPRSSGDDMGEAAIAEALFTAVAQRRELAQLATNPLLCALLCALHRQRLGTLPTRRTELYDAILSMLLDRRDRERSVGDPEGISLAGVEQRVLLQRLAYWLKRNGRTECSREQAVSLIRTVMAALPRVASQGGADQIYSHLLNRSGVLRQPASDAVEFVHRAFQDYLAAREAVESNDTSLLLAHAHENDWEDVFQLAVGVARVRERAELLRGILRRADSEPQYRVRLVLLAGATLELSTELEPSLRQEIVNRIAELIPPRTRDEAAELSRVGDLVLQLLPGPEHFSWLSSEARLVVYTAELVGSPSAEAFVQRFTALPDTEPAPYEVWIPDRPVVSSLLVDSWATRSDMPTVVHRTLELNAAEGTVDVGAFAGTVREVICQGDADLPISVLSRLPLLHTLDVVDNALLTHLDGLGDLRRLRTLRVRGCPALQDLTALEHTSVMFLEIAKNPGTAVLRGLATARRLRVLYLPGPLDQVAAGSLARHLPGVRIRAAAGFGP